MMEQYYAQQTDKNKSKLETISATGPLEYAREKIQYFNWNKCALLVNDGNLINKFRDTLSNLLTDPIFTQFNKYIAGEPVIVLEEIIALATQETGLDDRRQGGKGESGYFQIKPDEQSKLGIKDSNKAGLIRRLQVKSNWLFSFDKLERNRYLGLMSGEQKQQLIYLSYNRGSVVKGIIRKCAQEKTPVTFNDIMDKWYSTQEHQTMKTFMSPQFSNLQLTNSEVYFSATPMYGETPVDIDINPSENSVLFELLFPLYSSNPSYHLSVTDKRIGNKYMIQVKKITEYLK